MLLLVITIFVITTLHGVMVLPLHNSGEIIQMLGGLGLVGLATHLVDGTELTAAIVVVILTVTN
jgi:hypothetical protein